ncbi:MAG TPA: hypothetical protein VG097_14120, partial [Gemmata sp.]|nr:hypothetical protein [Gemmata sp.]
MSSTPSASSSEDKNRFTRQIEEAFEEAAKLAGSNLPPTDFYAQFLNRTLTAIDAPAGAVWLRTPQGFLQVACQINLDKVGLEAKRGGRQCHNEVLRQVFQAAPPRPILLEPNARLAPGPGEPGPVPPANLTDHFALFAPIIATDKQTLGVLEVFQNPSHDPRLYPAFLNYAFQMAGYASQYNHFITARAGSGSERTFTQIEAFARLIHGTMNPTEVAYHVANEGRKLIECDRLCVGVRHARHKVTVEAVSGADVVEKASTHVRRLRWLMEAVLKWGEPLTFKGTKDSGLPPDVAHALDEYLNESQPKLLIVQPIRDEREKDNHKPARSVLVLESFNPPDQTDPMVQKLEVIGKHAAPALYNAAELKRVPLKFLWWPLAKVQEGIGGKSRFYMIAGAILLAVLIGVMITVPYTLRMEAKGQLLPVEISTIYPPREGVIRDIRVKPGDEIDPRYAAVSLFSAEFQKDYQQALEKLRLANGQITTLGSIIKEISQNENLKDSRVKYETDLAVAYLSREAAQAEIEALNLQYNGVPDHPGNFRAIAPPFNPKLARPHNVSKWTVLNDDRRENLLGRSMRPHEELLRVGNLRGAWQIEMKVPQRNIGQIMKAFTDPDLHKVDAAGKPYLDVDVLLSSQAETSYAGRLYREDIAAQAVPNKNEHDENEPVVTAYVKLNLDDFPPDELIPVDQLVTGLEVRTRIRCGK